MLCLDFQVEESFSEDRQAGRTSRSLGLLTSSLALGGLPDVGCTSLLAPRHIFCTTTRSVESTSTSDSKGLSLSWTPFCVIIGLNFSW